MTQMTEEQLREIEQRLRDYKVSKDAALFMCWADHDVSVLIAEVRRLRNLIPPTPTQIHVKPGETVHINGRPWRNAGEGGVYLTSAAEPIPQDESK